MLMPETIGSTLVAVEAAAERLAQAMAEELRLHSQKGVEKSAAICRLMGTPNAETDKPHSASSAEKVVESDAEYAAFLAKCRQSIVARVRAEAEYEVAKLGARCAVELAQIHYANRET